MRRALMFSPAAALVLALAVLTGCGAPDAAGEALAFSPAELADAIVGSQADLPPLLLLTAGDDYFYAYLEGYYGLDRAEVADGAVYYAAGAEAAEVAVLRLRSEKAAEKAKEGLARYRTARAADFNGYAPEEADMAARGEALSLGDYAALVICPEPEAAEALLRDVYAGRLTALPTPVPSPAPTPEPTEAPEPTLPPELFAPPTETPAPEPELTPTPAPAPTPSLQPMPTPSPAPEPPTCDYDPERVTNAVRYGFNAGLSQGEEDVLEAAEYFVRTVTREDMTDYEKELAIHDWMIAWGAYDTATLSHAAGEKPDPDNVNPYGFLFHRKAVCTGYATTFQLFMDFLGIDCVTVQGTAYDGTEEHAWNMVRLDGEWYCVDVTWDDPLSRRAVTEEQSHRYFNVTSDFMRASNHQWDRDAWFEAAGTAWAWQGSAASPDGGDNSP